MLPEPQHRPPRLLQVGRRLRFAFDVAGDLVGPVLRVGGGLRVVLWAAVPETAVHEHGDPALPQYQISGTGQFRLRTDRDPEADTPSMHRRAHSQLWLRIAASIALHRLAVAGRGSPRRAPRAFGHLQDNSGSVDPTRCLGSAARSCVAGCSWST